MTLQYKQCKWRQ